MILPPFPNLVKGFELRLATDSFGANTVLMVRGRLSIDMSAPFLDWRVCSELFGATALLSSSMDDLLLCDPTRIL